MLQKLEDSVCGGLRKLVIKDLFGDGVRTFCQVKWSKPNARILPHQLLGNRGIQIFDIE